MYAVQGYDAGLLLAASLKAVKGDVSKKKELIAALEKAEIDSPRGKWKCPRTIIGAGFLPAQGGQGEQSDGRRHQSAHYPARGCKMG